MKVLIAVDATPCWLAVVREAVARPWPAGTKFCMFHAVDPYHFVKAPMLLARAKGAAQSQLKSAAESLQHAGWTAETETMLGNPRRAIADFALQWNADLVLVGSHGHGDLARILLGSTSKAALRNAHCSVEIVRCPAKDHERKAEEGMRILAATDGSDCSIYAMRSVAERPWPKGSEIKVISIPELIIPLREFPYFEPGEVEEINTFSLDHAREAATKAQKLMEQAGLKSSIEVPLEWDIPSRMILAEAEKWHAHMIVLGSHGRRGFDRWTMGSVSEAVALNAGCSVEVIREPSSEKNKGRKGHANEN